MSRVISVSETLDAAGGANDSYTEVAAGLNSNDGVLQVENLASGASTSVDFHLEARLADSLSWQDLTAAYTGLANGVGEMDSVPISGVSELRVRIVNQDGTNAADVAAELETR